MAIPMKEENQDQLADLATLWSAHQQPLGNSLIAYNNRFANTSKFWKLQMRRLADLNRHNMPKELICKLTAMASTSFLATQSLAHTHSIYCGIHTQSTNQI
jgi:hypothetical protein